MPLITFKTFDQSIDAHLLKSKLESEGIVCYLFDEHTVSVNPLYNITVGGIKLKINESDLEQAQSIYNTLAATPYTDDSGKVITCPNCTSSQIFTEYPTRKGKAGFLSTLAALVATIVPPYSKKVFKCKACGTEFN